MAESLENRGKLRMLIDKFQFVCMVNLNCILAIFPEWGGRKRRQNHKVGAESATKMIKWGQKAPPHIINKGFKGKIPC